LAHKAEEGGGEGSPNLFEIIDLEVMKKYFGRFKDGEYSLSDYLDDVSYMYFLQ